MRHFKHANQQPNKDDKVLMIFEYYEAMLKTENWWEAPVSPWEESEMSFNDWFTQEDAL